MKNTTQIKILDATLAICVVALIVLLVPLVLGAMEDKSTRDGINSVEDVVALCQNKDLWEAGECAVDITKSFFKYNLDNVGQDLSFQELKVEGGVCSSWSDYYKEVGQRLGFSTENTIIHVKDNIYHEFNVWSGEKGYCVLDQTNLSCVEFP